MTWLKASGPVLIVAAALVLLVVLRTSRSRPADDFDWPQEARTLADERTSRGAAPAARPGQPAVRSGKKGLFGPKEARPLGDAAFDPPNPGGGVFEQIRAALESVDVRHLALGTPDGDFLLDSRRGWLRFNGSGWVAVPKGRVPAGLAEQVPGDPRAVAR